MIATKYRFVTENPLNGNITAVSDKITEAIYWLLLGEKVSVYIDREDGFEFFRDLSIGGKVYDFDEIYTIGDFGTVWYVKDQNAFYVHLPDGNITARATETE